MLMSALFFMSVGGDVAVHGPVSRRLLIGMEEWSGAMAQYRPNAYRRVRFVPEVVVEGEVPGDSPGMAAFSGGVDAAFTLKRHHERRLGEASAPLQRLVLVHGFDVPLSDQKAFDKAYAPVKATADRRGVDLVGVRTNFRSLPGQDWEVAHMTGLVAVMTALCDSPTVGLVGSSYTYADPQVGWGSAPELDHLLSSALLEVRHDGADFTRSEKIALLAENPEWLEDLRVCWQAQAGGENCGRCEKCLRTQAALRACGITSTRTFPSIPDFSKVSLPALTDHDLRFWNEVVDFAESRGSSELAHNLRGCRARGRRRGLIVVPMRRLGRRILNKVDTLRG
ncbi:hypothetical protein O6R08_06160 [Cutibacterium equinum]|uniref:7-cyano-7-deazaguanine synthase n=1 Tax=Cutibacterium equinum TaxID=3016342 RepID=A0ABY7QVU7_9ACTN|nr:hypothetical protein [Cutibacterium equinum]WCC79141.1 hypothetical protein O6R08_06160 [Cutibacterium equinum]